MKSFIYLDTDTINSYIAQIDDGLKTLQTSTTQNSIDVSKQASHAVDGEGKIDFSILGKGIDAKLDYIYNHIRTTTSGNLYSDVETKIMHDNAFHQVINYLEKEKLFAVDDIKIGQFIKVSGNFHLLDLEYYKKLFDEQDFINMMDETKIAEIDALYDKQFQSEIAHLTLSREERRSQEYKNAERKLKAEKQKARNELKESNIELRKQLSLLLRIFPYKSFMCIDNYLAIFDEKYLREDIQKAPFKYGGKINMVGYVTNTTLVNQSSSFFSGPSDMINTILKSLFESDNDLFIVHPIALYYE